jgi:hypothetical protein
VENMVNTRLLCARFFLCIETIKGGREHLASGTSNNLKKEWWKIW